MGITINEISVDPLSVSDYEELMEAMKASYPDWQGSFWSIKSIYNLLDKFPEGQLAMRVNGKVIGCALSLIVDYDLFEDEHT